MGGEGEHMKSWGSPKRESAQCEAWDVSLTRGFGDDWHENT